MEPNGTNDNRVPTVLCKTGCGFYGSLACEGMCSKCYADLVKSRHETARAEKMGEQSSTGAEPLSNSRASSEIRLQQDHNSEGEGICEALRRTSVSEKDVNNETSSAENLNLSQSANSSATNSSTAAAAAAAAAFKNIEPTPQDTVEPAGIDKKSSADSKEANVSAEGKSKKSNRCHICKKKVGLTGFPCRCGGLYCSMHRYSDTHSCTFNYKELAQEDIRKNNPVVVGEKIRKI